ncbi:MAG: hemolysin III family protein [Negativicutes bacterium]|nr:hemolysin III family protein [Negativicutes bacterium]
MKKQLREAEYDPYTGLRFYSALTHGIGALLAFAGTLLLLQKARRLSLPPQSLPAVLIYGTSAVCLFTASSLYHSLRTGISGRLALRKLDHSMIYCLIAGTYTPICLVSLAGSGGELLFAVVWLIALGGTILSIFWIGMPRWLAAAIYIAMGWLAVFVIGPLLSRLSLAALGWLFGGGFFYTVGGVLYALKWPGRDHPRFGFHEVFHVFVVLGSICHFVLIYQFVI